TDSKIDLGAIVRNVDELMIINDEAHHVHDPSLVWFKSIQDIHNHLLQKGSSLSLQLDVTATPKHINGSIFVQTIVDYPLVEAIHQNVVKHPVLPDKPSREKLKVRHSVKYTEKFADFLKLGVIEWRKSKEEHQKLGKKAILFVMTDDTRNCDEVAEYLEANFPDLTNSVLVIHTKNNGDISEPSTGKAKEELEKLRKQANEIDSDDNQIKAIVSVLMLKEGWDVRNVTTIVGLRAFSAKSNILPEQTLGRGLRKMYPGFEDEFLSVVGTEPFMDFIDSIQEEGVELIRKPMAEDAEPIAPLIIEVDFNNPSKNIDDLDIEIPILTPRVYRDFQNLADLDPASFGHDKIQYKVYSEDELRKIDFAELTTGVFSHTSFMDDDGITDYRNVIGWFTRQVMKELRLFSFYDVLFGKLEDFIANYMFSTEIDLEDQNTIKNLSELSVTQIIHNTFKNAINNLTITTQINNNIIDYIRLKNMRPFIVKDQDYVLPKKSVFNKIIGDSGFELEFATFIDNCHDVISYAKNYISIKFYIEYVNCLGNLSNYYPDFFVKLSDNSIFIVETKGREELDLPLKMSSLSSWCKDINSLNLNSKFDFLFIDQLTFNESLESEHINLTSFHNLANLFTRFKS
ncbi:MAG: type III restriction endonuclease subunit R, partial [Deltaproteobacteria bacterium]|nr:type III restriction endonuclease subunit R [Deltaproteobacteria bacterium]